MKEKRYIAFWDVIICFVVCVPLIFMSIYLLVENNFFAESSGNQFPFAILFAIGIAVPFTTIFSLQRITINIFENKVEAFYLTNWRKSAFDIKNNWKFFPRDIAQVTLVNLSKEDKKKYTSTNFLFSKYIKIEMKDGKEKYLYVSHYSNYQIKNIISYLKIYSNKK